MRKTKAAFLFATQALSHSSLYLWTFTFRELLDIKDTRKRWNYLLTLIRRRWPRLCGIRVFEMHRRHGLHVHLVTNRFIHVNEARKLAKKAGWGRVHVCRIPAERATYLSKYLGKDRPPCFKGWRLWAGFGNWHWTRVKDVLFESPFCRIYRACRYWMEWKGNKDYFMRIAFVNHLYLRSIIKGWEPGWGPDNTPYALCDRNVLLGSSPVDPGKD